MKARLDTETQDGRKQFENHKATPSGPFEQSKPWHVLWKKDGTSIYYMDFVILRNNLYVSGDLGEAVYCWGESITPDFLAGLDVGYFFSKCEASENGRQGKEWLESAAMDWLKGQWDDIMAEHGEDLGMVAAATELFDDLRDVAVESTGVAATAEDRSVHTSELAPLGGGLVPAATGSAVGVEAKEEPMTPEEWIIKGRTGISSKTIWAALMGVVTTPTACRHGQFNIPYDPSDFLRCHNLLQAVPGWRERLPEVAAIFPKWGPFVEAWPELERLYEKEQHRDTAPLLYDKMQEVRELAGKAEDAFLAKGAGI